MADTVEITEGTGTAVSTEEITTLNGGAVSAQHAQRIIVATRSSDGVAVDADFTAGTAGSPGGPVSSIQGVTSMTPVVVGGAVAHDAADDSTGPVKVGGRYNSSIPALANGDRGDLQITSKGSLRTLSGLVAGTANDTGGNNYNIFPRWDLTDDNSAGKAGVYPFVYDPTSDLWMRPRGDTSGTVNQPHAVTALRWQYAAANLGIVNTTTAVTFKAAAGASVRNYVTAIQIQSETLGTATELAIRDGAGGTVLWRTKLGTAAQGLTNIEFNVPLKGTANTLLEVVTLTASGTGAVYFNAQGFTGS